MPFKPKTTKTITVTKKNFATLDGKHSEFINEFEYNETTHLPNLQKQKEL